MPNFVYILSVYCLIGACFTFIGLMNIEKVYPSLMNKLKLHHIILVFVFGSLVWLPMTIDIFIRKLLQSNEK